MTNEEMVEKLPEKFKEFALESGIGLIFQEDWEPWFECWKDGYHTGAEEWNDN